MNWITDLGWFGELLTAVGLIVVLAYWLSSVVVGIVFGLMAVGSRSGFVFLLVPLIYAIVAPVAIPFILLFMSFRSR